MFWGLFSVDQGIRVGGAQRQRAGSDTGVFVHERPGSTFSSLKTKPLLPMTSEPIARQGKKSERHCRGEEGNQEETAHGG